MTALSITSVRDDSGRQVTSCLGESEDAYRGPFETYSVKSSALKGNHDCSVARRLPFKSVAENVPISFLPLPCSLQSQL